MHSSTKYHIHSSIFNVMIYIRAILQQQKSAHSSKKFCTLSSSLKFFFFRIMFFFSSGFSAVERFFFPRSFFFRFWRATSECCDVRKKKKRACGVWRLKYTIIEKWYLVREKKKEEVTICAALPLSSKNHIDVLSVLIYNVIFPCPFYPFADPWVPTYIGREKKPVWHVKQKPETIFPPSRQTSMWCFGTYCNKSIRAFFFK